MTSAAETAELKFQLGMHRHEGFPMLKGRKWDSGPASFALDECVYVRRYCVQSWKEFISSVHAVTCQTKSNTGGAEGCQGPLCNSFREAIQHDCSLQKTVESGVPTYKCLCSNLVVVPKMRRIIPKGYPLPKQKPGEAEFCSHSAMCQRLSDRFAAGEAKWWCHRSAPLVEAEPCTFAGQTLQACPCVVNMMIYYEQLVLGKGVSKDTCENWSLSPNAMTLLLARPTSAAASFEVVDLPPEHPSNGKQKWTTALEYDSQFPESWQSFDIDDFDQAIPELNSYGASSNPKFPERGQSSSVSAIGAKRAREMSSSIEHSAIQMLSEALDLHLQGQKQVNSLDISSTDYDGQIGCSEPLAIFTEMASVSTGPAVDTDEIDSLIKSTSNFIDELPEMLNSEFIVGSDALHHDATQCSINDVFNQSAEINRKRKQKHLEPGESSRDASQSFRPHPAAGIHLANVADLDPGSSQQQLARDVSSQTSFATTANSQLINVDLGSLTSVDTDTDEPAVLNEEDIEQILNAIGDPFPPWL